MINYPAMTTHHRAMRVHVAMPQEAGTLALKSLAFAAVLVAGSSTSAHASSIGSVRLETSNADQVLVAREQDVRRGINEIRKRSGLTWAQLATLFGVSRRTIHSWMNGAVIRSANAHKVHEVLDRVRLLGDLAPFKIRNALLGGQYAAHSPETDKAGEQPILMSDNTPFAHQLNIRPARTIIKRG